MALTVTIGYRTLLLDEKEANDLRIQLQTWHLRRVIDEIIDNNPECFDFDGEVSYEDFVNAVQFRNEEYIYLNKGDAVYETIEEELFRTAEDFDIIRRK